jgi:hypothetical protein
VKINRKALRIWIGIHVGALIAVLLFPLYRRITRVLTVFLSSCVLHDRLHLYCPLCGGTRAIEAILRLDFAAAFSYNPLVILLLIGLLAWDLLALIRLLRGRDSVFALPTWVWITLIALAIAYGILRNALLVSVGYDPLGDLSRFWHPA